MADVPGSENSTVRPGVAVLTLEAQAVARLRCWPAAEASELREELIEVEDALPQLVTDKVRVRLLGVG